MSDAPWPGEAELAMVRTADALERIANVLERLAPAVETACYPTQTIEAGDGCRACGGTCRVFGPARSGPETP